jgi:glycosyltransferase involved in cell wall biosynthesis
MGNDVLYLVLPCYNEEKVLETTSELLRKKMNKMIENNLISKDSKIVFVDDGSADKTWDLVKKLNENDSMVRGIKLSRNRGHQNALFAGLMTIKSECDMVISLDADLQDDIEAIDLFVKKYNDGCDIVYGVRKNRDTDTFFKKYSAQLFYRLMKLLGVDIVYNHADYRLMSKRALEELENFKEVNLFIRGIVPMIGLKSDTVEYGRHERFAGESKYPLSKMLSFAVDGVTSFSVKPIRFLAILGVVVFLISMIMLIYFAVVHFTGHTVSGWTSIVVSVWAIGGIQLLALSVVGEYIGKIYMESKNRPKFIIEEYLK